jgi:hypothetical protein
MALTVDRPAVIAGARLAVIIGAAAIALAQAITSLTDSDANLPLYMVLLGGLGAGGRLAALRQPQSPLVLIVAITVIRLALGKEVADPVSLVFNGLMAASAGMFGGYLAVRQASREA